MLSIVVGDKFETYGIIIIIFIYSIYDNFRIILKGTIKHGNQKTILMRSRLTGKVL